MDAFFEGRPSDSPDIEFIWRGHAGRNYSPVCPADARWNLLFLKVQGQVRVSVEGPTTQSIAKYRAEESEFLVIKFKLGTFMPRLPVSDLVNGDVVLPGAARQSFWLNSSTWAFPDFNNVETFVERLVREGLLIRDPVVTAALKDQPQSISERTVRRRFLQATGLTHSSILQIERAQHATRLLEQGVPILETVFQMGYADQPHLTRSLKRFVGLTPAQIVPVSPPG